MEKLTLSKLIITARNIVPVRGNISGQCKFCGNKTENGHEINKTISGNFTKFNELYGGNCSCPECFEIFNDQVYRRKSWMVTGNEFKTYDKDEKKKLLYNVPEPPFFIHLAYIGQKQPWVLCFNDVAISKNFFYFTHENHGKIWFERKKWEYYTELIKKALEYKIGKMQLRGQFIMKTWQIAAQYKFEDLLFEINNCKNNPLWEVCLDVN